jgi:hypothetical protein
MTGANGSFLSSRAQKNSKPQHVRAVTGDKGSFLSSRAQKNSKPQHVRAVTGDNGSFLSSRAQKNSKPQPVRAVTGANGPSPTQQSPEVFRLFTLGDYLKNRMDFPTEIWLAK